MPRNRTKAATSRARAARRNPSVAEEIAWKFLRSGRLGFKFKREHPLLTYRLDFYCHEARLAVEFDGEQHDALRDAERDRALGQVGVAVFRVPNRRFFQINHEAEHHDWLRLLQVECEIRSGRRAFET